MCDERFDRGCSIGRKTEAGEYSRHYEEVRGAAGNVQKIGFCRLWPVVEKYAIGKWPAMKRVLECGDVELSNNLSEQMMRRIKMNLKNACNIGEEISAKQNAFMFSVIESCKMIKRNVEYYLKALFRRLQTAKEGEDLTCCLPCYMSF